ncbi:MAG: mechanosensitive ion channel [Planctomycetes bacterium]|nr:mechanosensitive ion channel [Planctomycetota bacterium]
MNALLHLRPWIAGTFGPVAAWSAAGALVALVGWAVLRRVLTERRSRVGHTVLRCCGAPVAAGVVLLFARLGMPDVTSETPGADFTLEHFWALAMIAVSAWALLALVRALMDLANQRFRVDVADNLHARKIHTHLRVLGRIAAVTVIVVAFATALTTFDAVRQLGVSLLASAGIIGIVAGFAAQKTLGNLLAGIQIALAQPIRIDDVVIVEGEWGRIEEITLTYVVVRIWDLRRLVLPITYFIDKPFQNWTRATSEIIGAVKIHVDYTVPVQALREELDRILQGSAHWNRRVSSLQVTDATDRTMEIRAIMSADDASAAWALRCEVREKLLTFVQQNYPDALPRLRIEQP